MREEVLCKLCGSEDVGLNFVKTVRRVKRYRCLVRDAVLAGDVKGIADFCLCLGVKRHLKHNN